MSPSLPDRGALTGEDVHLFLIPTDPAPPADLAHLETLVSAGEMQKIARLLIPAKRIESLISHGMLRLILARFLEMPPQQIAFGATAQGKPFVEGSPIRFNLSHTGGMVLIGVTLDHELGVDIERVADTAPTLDYESLARRFFSPAEYAGLLACPPAERRRAFYRGWTRKESLLKATGQGITGLATIEIPLYPWTTPATLAPPFEAWTLHDLPVPATHIASLAIGSPAVRLHQWVVATGERDSYGTHNSS